MVAKIIFAETDFHNIKKSNLNAHVIFKNYPIMYNVSSNVITNN